MGCHSRLDRESMGPRMREDDVVVGTTGGGGDD
jgi:hypothetical protein